MPRKAPDKVVEHRISLSNFERKEIKETLDKIDKLHSAQLTQSYVRSAGVIGLGLVGVAGGLVLGGLTLMAYREVNDLVEDYVEKPLSTGAWLWKNLTPAGWIYQGADYVFGFGDESPAEAAERVKRDNQGFLEWGFEWLWVFLLGKDKKYNPAAWHDEVEDSYLATQYEYEQSLNQNPYNPITQTVEWILWDDKGRKEQYMSQPEWLKKAISESRQ